MFQLEDYRKSQIFHDGKLEGKMELVPKLQAKGFSDAEIAEFLEVDVREVRTNCDCPSRRRINTCVRARDIPL